MDHGLLGSRNTGVERCSQYPVVRRRVGPLFRISLAANACLGGLGRLEFCRVTLSGPDRRTQSLS